jgi:MFS family permease
MVNYIQLMEIMQWLNILLFWLFFGTLSSHFAKRRGRNSRAWFYIGLLLGVIGVVLLFLLPKIDKPPVRQKPLPPKKSEAWLKMWYYLDPAHTQQGPLEFPDLIKKWKEKGISEKSYIWGEGMQEWRQLHELPDLLKEIEQA